MPPQDTFSESNPSMGRGQNNKNVAILILIFLILLGVSYLMLRSGKSGQNNTHENVSVAKVDLSKATGMDRVPAGVPNDVPLEIDNAKESSVVTYSTREVVLSTFSYTTTKTKSAVYNEYITYMTNSGYVFAETGRNEVDGVLYGTKNNDDLSVVISSKDGGTLVTLAFTDRK